MSQMEIREFTRAMPFKPFRIYVTTGETYDVLHPDMAFCYADSVIVSAKSSSKNVQDQERLCYLSLNHIVKLEGLHSEGRTIASGNGVAA